MNSRDRLEAILAAAIRGVDAGVAVEGAVDDLVASRDDVWTVLALGKAACAMAAPVERVLGPAIRAGLAVTKDGHATPLEMPVRETAHPVPDERCVRAADELLALARATQPDERLLVLLSGGASALSTRPSSGLDLSDLAETTRALLACGADIHEMNCVRKHLSAISGGRLAAAARAGRIDVLAVSDVPGDALSSIGSGPCAPDASRFADALAVLDRYQLAGAVPIAVRSHLEGGIAGANAETPKPGDPTFERVTHRIVASNRVARDAAGAEARLLGLEPVSLGECLTGEARDQARQLVAQAGRSAGPVPVCLIAGGETTVTLRGDGRGGRSQELALAAALELDGSSAPLAAVSLLAAGTDGSDGPTDAAGAFCDAGSVARGAARGVSASAALDDNDAYPFFEAEGGLVKTGPTGTNVMDLVLVEVPSLSD